MSLVPRETSGGFFDPKQDAEAKRRRRLAQQMMKAGEQPTSTEMVSGMAVKQSPLAALARAVQTGIGSYQENRADQIDAEAAKRRQEMIAQAVKQYGSNPQAASELLAQDPATSDAALKILSDIPAQGSMFSGNSIQAQIGNQMKAQGYSDQQILQALTMQGIPLQDGGYGVYSKVDRVGAPGGVPQGIPSPNPNTVQTSDLPESGGGSPFNTVLAELQGKPTGMDGQAPASAPVPNPPTPQQMANQAQSRFGGVDILVQPGMKQADRIELQQQVNKQGDALNATIAKAENVNQMIDKALEQTSGWSAGWGSKLAVLPATDARNLDATLDTIKANLGFDELNQMRQNSPTGGALGNVTERELAFLQSVTASLDQAQSPDQLRQNLAVIKQHFAGIRGRLEDAYARDLAQFGPQAMAGISIPHMAAAPQNVQQQPAYNADLLQYMTPEERALFQ